MREELAILCVRLRTEGKAVMSDIYNLTSPHVYGLIFRVVDEEKEAAHVLKAVYRRLWEQRHEFQKKTLEPLDWLRATAHRYAMDYKTTQSILCETPAISRKEEGGDPSQLQTLDLSEDEKTLFTQAYLQGDSLSDISLKHRQTVEEISQTLEKINQKIKRVG